MKTYFIQTTRGNYSFFTPLLVITIQTYTRLGPIHALMVRCQSEGAALDRRHPWGGGLAVPRRWTGTSPNPSYQSSLRTWWPSGSLPSPCHTSIIVKIYNIYMKDIVEFFWIFFQCQKFAQVIGEGFKISTYLVLFQHNIYCDLFHKSSHVYFSMGVGAFQLKFRISENRVCFFHFPLFFTDISRKYTWGQGIK